MSLPAIPPSERTERRFKNVTTGPTARIADFLAVQLRKQAAADGNNNNLGGGTGGGRRKEKGGGGFRNESTSASPSISVLSSEGERFEGRNAPSSSQVNPTVIPVPVQHQQLPNRPNQRHNANMNPVSGTTTATKQQPQSHNLFPNETRPGSSFRPINANSSHRHRDQQERVYAEPKYDAEFDRGLAAPIRSSSTTIPPPPVRNLFNPDQAPRPATNLAPPNAAVAGGSDPFKRIEREDNSARRLRSKRDVIDPNDLGLHKKGRESKESIGSEDSGKPGSRSSKEGRHRRKKNRDGEERIARQGGIIEGATVVPGLHHQTSSGNLNPVIATQSGPTTSSRQLFDPRKDDPVRFTPSAVGSPRPKKPTTPSILSTHSATSTLTPVETAAPPDFEENSQNNGARQQDIVGELKRAYRDIVELESKLQDEHKAATREEEDLGHGVRIQGARKKYDDDYWVRLATGHKQYVLLIDAQIN
jgi:protein SMG6